MFEKWPGIHDWSFSTHDLWQIMHDPWQVMYDLRLFMCAKCPPAWAAADGLGDKRLRSCGNNKI